MKQKLLDYSNFSKMFLIIFFVSSLLLNKIYAFELSPKEINSYINNYSSYSILSFGNVSMHSSDAEGIIAAANNVDLSDYSVGAKLNNNDSDVLISGNDINFSRGSVNGNISYNGNINADQVSAHSIKKNSSNINFVDLQNKAQFFSKSLASLSINSNLQKNNSSLILNGNNDINVFNVSSSDLLGINAINVIAPISSYSVINVQGTNINLSNISIKNSNIPSKNIIYNFTNTNYLSMSALELYGNVLAVNADVNFNNGVITGLLVAKNLQGQGQLNINYSNITPIISSVAPSPTVVPITPTATVPIITNTQKGSVLGIQTSAPNIKSENTGEVLANTGTKETYISFVLGGLILSFLIYIKKNSLEKYFINYSLKAKGYYNKSNLIFTKYDKIIKKLYGNRKTKANN